VGGGGAGVGWAGGEARDGGAGEYLCRPLLVRGSDLSSADWKFAGPHRAAPPAKNKTGDPCRGARDNHRIITGPAPSAAERGANRTTTGCGQRQSQVGGGCRLSRRARLAKRASPCKGSNSGSTVR